MIIKDLNTLNLYLETEPLRDNDIASIMVVIRNELEKNNKKEDFRFLNMFCNWCVHPEISRSKKGFEIIELFAKAISTHDQSGGASAKQCTKTIVENFYYELKMFFIVNKLNIDYFDDKNPHKPFFLMIIKLVEKRSVVMPDKKYIEKNKLQERERKLSELLGGISTPDKKLVLRPVRLSVTLAKSNYYWSLETEGTKNIDFQIPIFKVK